MSYETAVDLLPAPSIQSNLQPVYKTPSTLLTHKVPQLPSCFSTSYFYFSNLVPMCDRARASLVSSINARIGNSKTPPPPSSENKSKSRGLFIDRRTTPQDFRSVSLPHAPEPERTCVSYRRLHGVYCGLAQCRLFRPERTRPPDTPHRLSLIYFWVSRGALPCLATVRTWEEACRLPRGLCLERTNERASERTLLGCASSVPSSQVRYHSCLEFSCRRRKVYQRRMGLVHSHLSRDLLRSRPVKESL